MAAMGSSGNSWRASWRKPGSCKVCWISIKKNNLIHWEKFLEFEERHGLFQWEEDGLYIWDILRFHVYVDFIWDTYRERQPKPSRLKLLLKVIRRIGYLLVFPFRRGRPNLFHIHSRDRDSGGLHYDKNADDFLQRL